MSERGHDCDDQCGQICACGAAVCDHGYEVAYWLEIWPLHQCEFTRVNMSESVDDT